MSTRSFKDLKAAFKRQQAAQAQAEAALELERQRQVKAARQAQAERDLFAATVGPIRPIKASERAPLPMRTAAPVAMQQQLDDEAVLHESLSDDFDVSTLLDTDADLSFAQPGIGSDVVRKLRKGHWALQGEIDLHGLRSDDARLALVGFLHQATKRGHRCIRVVHGKGLGSPGRQPVLKTKVLRWLIQRQDVLAFVQAPPNQGGAGALMVLLKGR